MTDTCILVVDDNAMNRDLLASYLTHQGYHATLAENGQQALEMLHRRTFDLVLLDVMMPHMTGYEVLATLKADPDRLHIPIIMISALNDLETTAKCIELGAEDYLMKPFNRTLLKARINASLQKKRIRDIEQAYLESLQVEREKADRLLLNVLPEPIAEQLKDGNDLIAECFPNVTVIFADIVNFTKITAHIDAPTLVAWLNDVFSRFDSLILDHGLEKIKTIGDAYMAVAGLPRPNPHHAQAAAEAALAMQAAVAGCSAPTDEPFSVRIGLHSGPVIGGVIGQTKFIFDLWGETVNTASRMESQGVAGKIQVSEATYAHLFDRYDLESRPNTLFKGIGAMQTYFLVSKL